MRTLETAFGASHKRVSRYLMRLPTMLTSGRNNLRLVRYLPNGNPHVAWKIKNGLAAMRRNRYQLVWLLDCARTAAIQPGLAAQSMRLFRRRTALRLWCSLARRLALLHLLLLSGMLLLKLLRLLSAALPPAV